MVKQGKLKWHIVALMVAALTAAATPRVAATAIVPLAVAMVATGCAIVVVSTTVDDTSNKPLP